MLRSKTVPTVTVNGPDQDGVTARVLIETGSRPLYIILATYDQMIWRFEGDTARIERVVLRGYGAQGLTGVLPELVTISGKGPIFRAMTGVPCLNASIKMMPKVSKHTEGTMSATACS